MANTVEILVKGTDQSGGKAIRQVGMDAKQAREHVSGMATGLKLAGVAAAGFAATKLVSFLRDSVNEARESQKVNAQTAAVLKSTGNAAHITADQIGELATKISNKTGIDDEQIQSSENMLLTFTNVRNEVGRGNDVFNQATQTVTDMSVALGVDGKNAAIMLGKALNDPITGVTALQRVGVTFTEEQKKQIKTLMQHNNILGAQKIILKELSKEFGGSAAAQATAGEKMKTAWNNFKESVGTKLLPILDKLENWLSQKVLPAIQNKVIPAILAMGDWIAHKLVPVLTGQLIPAISDTATALVKSLYPALQKTLDWMGDHTAGLQNFGIAAAIMFAAFKGYQVVNEAALAFKALTLAMAENPLTAVAVGLLAIATYFVVVYRRSREFRDNVQDAFSDFKIWAAEAGMAFEQYFVQYVIAGLKFMVDGLVRAFGWMPLGVGKKLHEMQNAVHGFADDVRDHIGSMKADIKTEQAKMKARDLQRQIDSIRQNKVPGIKAGTGEARYQIALLQYQIDHLQGKAIRITTLYTEVHNIYTVQNAVSNRGPAGVTGALGTGGIVGAAAGGIHGGLRWVGEYGPELVRLPSGSSVYPSGQSKGMANRMADKSGPIVLEIHSGGTRLDDLLVEVLRKAVRVRGGNVQTVIGR